MASSTTDEPLSSEEIDAAFGEPEAIEDELLATSGEVPIVEPRAAPATPGSGSGIARALWFVGFALIALLVLQASQLLLDREARRYAPSYTRDPGGGGAETVTPSQEIDRTLRDMRVKLTRSLYEDVLRILEPLVAEPDLLDANQRFEAYLLLARAHRALDNVEKAQEYSLRATDQSIERRAPALILEYSSSLAAAGRFEEARRELSRLLARRDSFTAQEDVDYLVLAEARVGDALWAQAQEGGHLAPLPERARAAEPGR